MAGNLSLEDGQKALLLQNKEKGYQFQMQDGTGVTLEQLHVKRRVTGEMDEEGTMYPVMKITVRGQIETTNRVGNSREKSDWKKKAEEELQEQLQQLVTECRKPAAI